MPSNNRFTMATTTEERERINKIPRNINISERLQPCLDKVLTAIEKELEKT